MYSDCPFLRINKQSNSFRMTSHHTSRDTANSPNSPRRFIKSWRARKPNYRKKIPHQGRITVFPCCLFVCCCSSFRPSLASTFSLLHCSSIWSSEKPICLQHNSIARLVAWQWPSLKSDVRLIAWQRPSLVLSRNIVKHLLLPRLSPPSDRWCDLVS